MRVLGVKFLDGGEFCSIFGGWFIFFRETVLCDLVISMGVLWS